VTGHPSFLWWDDVRISEDELRAKLRSPDLAERGTWAGRLLREAALRDVWRFVSVKDILRDWPIIERNLGRRRAFWKYLLDGWRSDGLIS
jgi:hypothetical protein